MKPGASQTSSFSGAPLSTLSAWVMTRSNSNSIISPEKMYRPLHLIAVLVYSQLTHIETSSQPRKLLREMRNFLEKYLLKTTNLYGFVRPLLLKRITVLRSEPDGRVSLGGGGLLFGSGAGAVLPSIMR